MAQLSEALHCLSSARFEAVLLDLALPDSLGLETFTTLHAHAPQVPIVVLTALHDEVLGMKTVQEGAQNYLIKGRVW